MTPLEIPIPTDVSNSVNAQYNIRAQEGSVEEEKNRKRKPEGMRKTQCRYKNIWLGLKKPVEV